jgi:hypothetical protein
MEGESMPTRETVTVPQALELAARLTKPGAGATLAEQVAALETDGRQAGRLIRVMLRQIHSSDVFDLPPMDAARGGGI